MSTLVSRLRSNSMVNYRPENSHFYWFFRYVHHVHRRYRSNLFPLISSDLSFLSIFDWTSWTYLKAPKNGIKRPFSLATACPPPVHRLDNELRVCAARSRRRSSVGRTRGVGRRLALWRFHQRRSAPGLMIAARPAWSALHDGCIAVGSGSFKTIGSGIWSKVGATGCVTDRGSPWRAEARSGKTGRWRRRLTLSIMAPWPGAVSAA